LAATLHATPDRERARQGGMPALGGTLGVLAGRVGLLVTFEHARRIRAPSLPLGPLEESGRG
jgi:hypothetical protein